MGNFQVLVGFPQMGKKVFKVAMKNKKTKETGWHEYIPAETSKEAKRKVEEALKKLSEENDFYKSCEPVVESSFAPRFDGGETPGKWKAWGFPKGNVPDQYVSACPKGGINLNIFRLCSYRNVRSIFNERGGGCDGCGNLQTCSNTAYCAGEQSEP